MLELHIAASAAFYGEDASAVAEHTTLATALAQGREPALVAAAEALGALASMWHGEPEKAAPLVERASELFAALSDDELARWPDTAYWVGFTEILFEFPARTLTTTRRGIAVARAAGQERSTPMAACARCRSALKGRDTEAIEMIDAVEDACRLQGVDSQSRGLIWQRAGISACAATRSRLMGRPRGRGDVRQDRAHRGRASSSATPASTWPGCCGPIPRRTSSDEGDRPQTGGRRNNLLDLLWSQLVIAELSCGPRSRRGVGRADRGARHAPRPVRRGGPAESRTRAILIATASRPRRAPRGWGRRHQVEERGMGTDLMTALSRAARRLRRPAKRTGRSSPSSGSSTSPSAAARTESVTSPRAAPRAGRAGRAAGPGGRRRWDRGASEREREIGRGWLGALEEGGRRDALPRARRRSRRPVAHQRQGRVGRVSSSREG